MTNTTNIPTSERERHIILDALRGFALMGIILANFPEFGLWSFLSASEQAAMPTARVDEIVHFLLYFLVDGKFYTIFSLLFGVGFSIILSRHGKRLFLRRMLILIGIGFCHLMFLWSGDILLLYGVGGLLLMCFTSMSDKTLLFAAIALIFLPVGLDVVAYLLQIDYAAPFYNLWWSEASAHGITKDNFATWLRDADSYGQMFAFLIQGACERLWEFVSGHRLPKVLGLFIIGYIIGKRRLYARLDELPLHRLLLLTFIIGCPMSLIYAWSAVASHSFGQIVHSLLYAISVIPMALFYVCLLCILYQKRPKSCLFARLAAPGRMALSCYISQSIVGVVLFYGIGLGLGLSFGLVQIELTALLVYFCQIVFCLAWFRWFRFGLLEWLWRMLTYRRFFPLLR